MNDGFSKIILRKPFTDKGWSFEPLRNEEVFNKTLTAIGNTIAWDLEGNRDEYKCLDIDPFEVYKIPIVEGVPEM